MKRLSSFNASLARVLNPEVTVCVIFPDIYTGWMAQVLDADLLVETWRTIGHAMPSNCSLHRHTMNIKRIKLPGMVKFQSNYDHSKWCVSLQHEEQVTCLGDLNREKAQMWRGGGLLCSFNPLIYKAFRQGVDWYNSCKNSIWTDLEFNDSCLCCCCCFLSQWNLDM